jgi:hypothetical protein
MPHHAGFGPDLGILDTLMQSNTSLAYAPFMGWGGAFLFFYVEIFPPLQIS